MRCANKVGTGARLGESVASIGVGGCVGNFTHAGLHVDQDYVVACGGLAGGLVAYRAGQGCGLGQGG